MLFLALLRHRHYSSKLSTETVIRGLVSTASKSNNLYALCCLALKPFIHHMQIKLFLGPVLANAVTFPRLQPTLMPIFTLCTDRFRKLKFC